MLPMLLLLDLVLLQQMLDHAALMAPVMGQNLNYGTKSLCISVYQDQDLHNPSKGKRCHANQAISVHGKP